MAFSTPAVAQTSDAKVPQSDATTQPVQTKSHAADDNPVMLNNYAQAMAVAAPGEDDANSNCNSDCGDTNTALGNHNRGGRKDVTIGRESISIPKSSLTDCVTETGAVDANCDGVADINPTTKIDRERPRPQPRQQRR